MLGSLIIVVPHHKYFMPPYRYLATNYGTLLSLCFWTNLGVLLSWFKKLVYSLSNNVFKCFGMKID